VHFAVLPWALKQEASGLGTLWNITRLRSSLQRKTYLKKSFSFHSKFFPVALLSNLEHHCSLLRLSNGLFSRTIFLLPQSEEKNAIFIFFRQKKFNVEFLFDPRIEYRRKWYG
jgi:hypothetical protein